MSDVLEQLRYLGNAYDDIAPVTIDEITLVRPIQLGRHRPRRGLRAGLAAASVVALAAGGWAILNREALPITPAVAPPAPAPGVPVQTDSDGIPVDSMLVLTQDLGAVGSAEVWRSPSGVSCLKLLPGEGSVSTCSEQAVADGGGMFFSMQDIETDPPTLVGVAAASGTTIVTAGDVRVEAAANTVWTLTAPLDARDFSISTLAGVTTHQLMSAFPAG